MTPKEKAIELVSKFRNEFKWVEKDHHVDLYRDTRQCALIAIDEIIEVINESMLYKQSKRDFWKQVKQEIEKL